MSPRSTIVATLFGILLYWKTGLLYANVWCYNCWGPKCYDPFNPAGIERVANCSGCEKVYDYTEKGAWRYCAKTKFDCINFTGGGRLDGKYYGREYWCCHTDLCNLSRSGSCNLLLVALLCILFSIFIQKLN
ncbi:unnamed protein product [Calicophoron daubneyi]|uniref:Uncharacterized protein n=1 Tax=Calicophoron daubneyi TaxID=300641 RepID=A0AAV2TSP6_CALDB